jgi:glycosyltransferase involved in cell wall biosynthesis
MLLTIYIPTYNRCSSLLKQINNINNYNGDNFKVVINDNNSTDNYQEIIDFCKDKDNFFYQNNLTNIGAEANIVNGFLHSFNSEYIWILSDDDILQKDALQNILSILNNNNLDLLFLTHNKLQQLELLDYNQKILYEKNIKKSDGAGLISNVIYKSKFIKKSIPVGFNNIYTCFAHLAVLINALQKNAQVANIGAHKFFIPDTELPPANPNAYSKSYFGFVLLSDLFDKKTKIDFLKDWTKFCNLKHWYFKSKDKNAECNCIYAKSILQKYSYFFSTKLAIVFFY